MKHHDFIKPSLMVLRQAEWDKLFAAYKERLSVRLSAGHVLSRSSSGP